MAWTLCCFQSYYNPYRSEDAAWRNQFRPNLGEGARKLECRSDGKVSCEIEQGTLLIVTSNRCRFPRRGPVGIDWGVKELCQPKNRVARQNCVVSWLSRQWTGLVWDWSEGLLFNPVPFQLSGNNLFGFGLFLDQQYQIWFPNWGCVVQN